MDIRPFVWTLIYIKMAFRWDVILTTSKTIAYRSTRLANNGVIIKRIGAGGGFIIATSYTSLQGRLGILE